MEGDGPPVSDVPSRRYHGYRMLPRCGKAIAMIRLSGEFLKAAMVHLGTIEITALLENRMELVNLKIYLWIYARYL
jgi:hypothetical protein